MALTSQEVLPCYPMETLAPDRLLWWPLTSEPTPECQHSISTTGNWWELKGRKDRTHNTPLSSGRAQKRGRSLQDPLQWLEGWGMLHCCSTADPWRPLRPALNLAQETEAPTGGGEFAHVSQLAGWQDLD